MKTGSISSTGGKERHLECLIADRIYAHLYEFGQRIGTYEIEIPRGWLRRWPSDAQVRFFIHRRCNLSAKITVLRSKEVSDEDPREGTDSEAIGDMGATGDGGEGGKGSKLSDA